MYAEPDTALSRSLSRVSIYKQNWKITHPTKNYTIENLAGIECEKNRLFSVFLQFNWTESVCKVTIDQLCRTQRMHRSVKIVKNKGETNVGQYKWTKSYRSQ